MKTRASLWRLLLIFTTIGTFAQQGINYKALIKNGSGHIVANQNVTIQFQILKGVGMILQYQETHAPMTDVNGIAMVNIGKGTSNSGNYSTIDWGSDDHYLNVKINTGGGLTDMGTTQFMAVPYALYAKTVSGAATKIDELSDGKADANGSSLFLGMDAGLADDGTDNANVGVGFEALKNNSTGYNNTGFGNQALRGNTTGFDNTATGIGALNSNTDGRRNAAHGAWALNKNTTGLYNTANGYQALYSNITGLSNTATGLHALPNNTTGNNNTATGSIALYSNTTGIGNTATGFNALYGNTTGLCNTATGLQALYGNTTGNFNTGNGYYALFSNSTGNYNTSIGSNALYLTTASSYNTAIGYNAGRNYNNGYNNVFVGANTDVNGTGYFNVIAIGQGTICTASSQVTIGNGATNSYRAYANWSNISDGRYKKNIKDNVPGLDFITQLKPVTYNLDATGLDAFLHKYSQWDTESKLSGEAAGLKQKALKEKEKVVELGFVAQDVERVANGLGFDFNGVDRPSSDHDVYGLRYTAFVVPLVKAVQEQQEIIENQKAQINSLSLEVAEIKKDHNKRIESLLNRVQQIEHSMNQ